MTTFAVTDPEHTIAALNYVLSNLGTGNATGNTSIPGNVLVANSTSNSISTYGGGTIIAYVNEFLNVRYANTATGSSGFNINQANANYYGVFNTVTSTDPNANNPVNYQWFQVTGGFGTTKTLYYLCNGGRQVQLAATTSAPSSGYLPTVNGTPIDLDIVTTANGTPGARGAIAMAYVLTPGDPNTSGNTALSTWFAASRTNTVPPIGTGLTPVSGDTADFLYPATNVSGTYTFNGSGWDSAVAQVVAGNTIVDGTITGNTIANNTVTGNNIVVGSVSGDRITVNTLYGNTIIANTLFGNAIIANTLYGNTIIANTLYGNAIIANTISGNTIIANSFSANTINGSAVIAGTIAANTINGNSIVSGSITTDQLAANVLTANTVVSTGATIGNYASPGFWLQGSTGNARFGNTVNIGSGLVVGNNASIGGNLTIGANTTIGANLIVGSGANIGTNLQVGNNASIGGNLSVTGLVTGGNLNANTVSTTTITTGAVSSFTSYSLAGSGSFAPSLTSGVWTTWPATTGGLTLTTVQTNQTVFLWENAWYTIGLNNSGGASTSATIGARIVRWSYPSLANVTPIFTWQYTVTVTTGAPNIYTIQPNQIQLVDTIPTAGSWQYAYQLYWQSGSLNVSGYSYTIGQTGTSPAQVPLTFLALALKR